MNAQFTSLFQHEKEALLEALRRDARSQLSLAMSNSREAGYHMGNYRAAIRLLDVLNPKVGHHRAGRSNEPLAGDVECKIKEAA